MHLEDRVERRNCVSGGGKHVQILDPGHDLGCWDVGDGHFFGVVEERVLIKMDPRLVNATAGEGVSYPLGYHDGYHDGQDVGQRAGEFEHDYDNGDGHSSDACQGRGCADDGVCAWGDARDVWCARGKEDELGVVVNPDFHYNSHGAACQCANCHGWKDDAGGNLEAKGDACEEEAQYRRKDEQHDGPGGCCACPTKANGVVKNTGAFREQARHELRRLDFHVKVWVVDESCEESHGKNLNNRSRQPTLGLLPACDSHVGADEKTTVNALLRVSFVLGLRK